MKALTTKQSKSKFVVSLRDGAWGLHVKKAWTSWEVYGG
jgi:hypothetical protein